MAKQPASGQNNTSDHLQTWYLRVYIHCEGCKKKVFKVLQSIDGVYKTVIDAKEHKATVTGSVNGELLVQKLLKSGKHAEILPESFPAPAADNASGNSKKKKKQNNKQNDTVPDAGQLVNNDKDGSKDVTTNESDNGNEQEKTTPAVSTVDSNNNSNSNETGGGKKKKKNKKKKGDNNKESNGPPKGDPEVLPKDNPTAENAGNFKDCPSVGPVVPQMVYSTPYEVPPYQYYPTPAYGVSYNTSYPSAESSYYTPPVYGYAQSHPSVSVYYPPPPSSSSYGRSAFDDNDDEGGEGRWCTIM